MFASKYFVLISGKMGGGKTTLQSTIIEKWNGLSNHKGAAINFADILYEMHDAVRSVTDRYRIPKKMPKDGALLQLLGTEWGRKTLGEEVWIEALKRRVELISAREGIFAYDNSLFVVGDCRFRNEFDAFPNALRVRLNCPEGIRRERCSAWREKSDHPSEIDLDMYSEDFKFDKYYDTSLLDPATIADNVVETLHQNSWIEERK